MVILYILMEQFENWNYTQIDPFIGVTLYL